MAANNLNPSLTPPPPFSHFLCVCSGGNVAGEVNSYYSNDVILSTFVLLSNYIANARSQDDN